MHAEQMASSGNRSLLPVATEGNAADDGRRVGTRPGIGKFTCFEQVSRSFKQTVVGYFALAIYRCHQYRVSHFMQTLTVCLPVTCGLVTVRKAAEDVHVAGGRAHAGPSVLPLPLTLDISTPVPHCLYPRHMPG